MKKNLNSGLGKGEVFENNPLFKELNQSASTIYSGKRDFEKIEVGMEPDDTMMEMLYMKVSSLFPSDKDLFSQDEFKSYIRTLYQYRIDLVNSKRIAIAAKKVYAVPSLIGLILAQIGPVTDYSFGVHLVPKSQVKDTLKEEEMLRISVALTKLADNGFRIIKGIPTHYEGELGFMSTALHNEIVKSYRDGTAPGIALLSAVSRNQLLNVTLQMATEYGMYQEYIDALRTVIFGSGDKL